jgi:hypothetical protein
MSSVLISLLSVAFAGALVLGVGAGAIMLEYLKHERQCREYRRRNRRHSSPVV